MVSRNSLGFALAAVVLLTTAARAQGGGGDPMPNPQEMQMQVQHIMQERPREAEAAARAWLQNVAPNLIPSLDSLKTASGDQYWAEVGQLTVQFDVFQRIWRRDSVRAQLVGKMFGLEASARAQQRAYRNAAESARPAIRAKIEALITQHFDLEDQLRALEIADIERRLADVRAESQRRKDRRAEFIRFAVDDIVRDAVRPE
jgi:molecular chaperone GrpE (heat shock protein)